MTRILRIVPSGASSVFFEMISLVYFGGAEGDRTPDPKTASRERQKITNLDKSPGFPFKPTNQRVDRLTMIINITMTMPISIFYSTFLAQYFNSYKKPAVSVIKAKS
jgi:hypothetical protein